MSAIDRCCCVPLDRPSVVGRARAGLARVRSTGAVRKGNSTLTKSAAIGVGRAQVPLRLRDALRGGQNVEALVALGAEKIPRALQMADQAVRLVLRGDGDAADAGIQRVGQGEIDKCAICRRKERPAWRASPSVPSDACHERRTRQTPSGIVRVNSILPARASGRPGAPLFLLTNHRRARPDSTPKMAYTYLP